MPSRKSSSTKVVQSTSSIGRYIKNSSFPPLPWFHTMNPYMASQGKRSPPVATSTSILSSAMALKPRQSLSVSFSAYHPSTFSAQSYPYLIWSWNFHPHPETSLPSTVTNGSRMNTWPADGGVTISKDKDPLEELGGPYGTILCVLPPLERVILSFHF